jgi:hypothetical protein
MSRHAVKRYQAAGEFLAQLIGHEDDPCIDEKIDEVREHMMELQREMDDEERALALDAVYSISLRRINRLN